MSHSIDSAFRPTRSARVVFGGLVATATFLVTLVFTAPDVYWALSSDSEPTEMSWRDYVKNRDRSPSHLRLVDVDIEAFDVSGDSSAASDSSAAREALQNGSAPLWDRAIAYVRAQATEPAFRDRVARIATVPPQDFLKILPRGYSADQVPAVIVMPKRAAAYRIAATEIRDSRSLTGHFRSLRRSPMADRIARLAGVELAEPTFDRQYVFELDATPPSKDVAFSLFGLTAGLFVVSLVWCCSGAPSWAACLFSPLQALISLLGYPLRYGRANPITRIACLGAVAWIGWCGYHLAYETGGLGRSGGHFLEISVGVGEMLIAAAGFLGVVVSYSGQRTASESKFGNPVGSGPTVIDAETNTSLDGLGFSKRPVCRYTDPTFVIPAVPNISDEASQLAAMLTKLKFNSALATEIQQGEEHYSATTQLGCEQMVLARIDDRRSGPRVSLITVLADGFVVTSVAKTTVGVSEMEGDIGVFWVHPCSDISTLLSEHLQRTMEMAQHRGTEIVLLSPSEWRDVVKTSMRFTAELRRAVRGDAIDVPEAEHGRFEYPPAPVPADEPIAV